MMKKMIASILLSLTCFSATADIAVIVHPSNIDTLDKSFIARIYLGKNKSFPNGSRIIALNQTLANDIRKQFNDKVIGKSTTQLKAYWSKLLFTGKGTPPEEMDSDAEVIELIANNPNMIGYVNKSAITPNVKIVAEF